MYDFLLNMWVLGKIDEEYLDKMVDKGFISENEKNQILDTSQIK